MRFSLSFIFTAFCCIFSLSTISLHDHSGVYRHLQQAVQGRKCNETQYFDGVLSIAWEFYIGDYQPTQKWLKDRKGKELSFEDVRHYQRIIVALTETARIMRDIDEVSVE